MSDTRIIFEISKDAIVIFALAFSLSGLLSFMATYDVPMPAWAIFMIRIGACVQMLPLLIMVLLISLFVMKSVSEYNQTPV